MSQFNLHIFSDPQGFFTNKTVDFVNAIQPGQNLYLNTVTHCANKKPEIYYGSVENFLKSNSQHSLKLVIFHSYNYFNKGDIGLIKATYPGQPVKFGWIFWSHEYYQLPEFFSKLYQGFSKKFYFQKLASYYVSQLSLFIKGKADFPVYLGLKSLKKTFKEFSVFCAFVKGDYEIVMKDNPGVHFRFSSYLTVNDFPAIDNDLSQEKTGIMIGHCGSPILNHYEIIKSLSDMAVANAIFLPLSYGKKSYIRALLSAVKKLNNIHVTVQTDFLAKDDYYRKIGEVGYFILNSACQQALGNIVFFLWTGTKIFIQKNTSTYKTLTEQGFYVYSIEHDLTLAGLQPLTPEQKQHNFKLISVLLSEENIKNSWLSILNFNE
jgi:hypothetical protein